MSAVIFQLCLIGVSVLAGAINFYKIKSPPLKIFFFFLTYTFLSELVATILMRKGINNHWWYNIYNYIRFPVFGFIYYQLLKSSFVKKFIVGCLFCLPFLFLLNISFYHSFLKLHSLTIIAGCTFIIIVTTCFFYEQLKYTESENIFQNPFFWISTGLLFYFLVLMPFLGTINFLNDRYRPIALQLYFINRILNVLMYTLFIVAFFCTWQRRKSPILL
jgi:hypothetical protein